MFSGFPKEALDFYRGIALNNSKEYFEAHREVFSRSVVAPAQSFIMELGARLKTLRPELGFNPDVNGKGSFKKIHTDRRFNPGRVPFKTNCQMIFWEGPLATKKANSLFAVVFDPDKLLVAAGLKYFDGKLIDRYRQAVDNPSTGEALAREVEALRAEGYRIGDVGFKKIPRGYAPEHPRGELLKHEAISAWIELPITEAFYSADLISLCFKHHQRLLGLHAWCVELLKGA